MSDSTNFPQILAVSSVITNEKNEVLLTWRDKEPGKDSWQLVAGYLEPGERLVEAVQRQLKSKVGITDTLSIEFTGKYYDDPNRNPGAICIPFIFHVRVKNDVTVSTDRKYQWFSKAELKDLPMALDNKQTLIDLGLC